MAFNAQALALLGLGVDDLAVHPDRDVQRHPGLDPVVAVDHMVQDSVDGVGLRFGEETDAPQIDAEHRDVDAAGQFRGPQERAVAAEDQHQFTTQRSILVGIDHVDLDTHRPQIVGSQV